VEIDFLENALADIEYWRKSGNKNGSQDIIVVKI